MFVFALHPAVLREPPVGQRADRRFERAEAAQNGNILRRRSLLGFFMAAVRRVRLRHRRDVRRGDGRRQPPGAARRPVVDPGSPASSARSSCWRSSCRSRTSRPRWPRASAVGFPIATTITDNLSRTLIGDVTVGELYLLRHPRVASSSARWPSRAPTTRLMFSMGRDRHLPLGGPWGHVNSRFQTPANAPIAVGVLAAIPILVVGPVRRISIVDRGDRPDLHLRYFLCNLGVLVARRRGWPHQKAWFKPRSLGHAHQHPRPRLGRPDGHQHRPLDGPERCSASSATTCATRGRTRSSTRSSSSAATVQEQLPAWPIFETIVGAVLHRRRALLPGRPARQARPGRGRGRRGDRRGRHRLVSRDMRRRPILRGPAVRRPRPGHAEGPGDRRARADPDRPVGRDHEPELPGRRGRHRRALGHPAGRQRHAPARDLPGGGARRDGRGGRRRRRAGGDRVHPARGLSRHPVHRRLAGVGRGGPSTRRRSGASPIRSGGSTTARPSRACSCRSGSSRRTGRWRWPAASPIPPEYELAAAVGRRIEVRLPGRPDRAAAVPQRPAQRELHRRRDADPDHRLGVRRDGRPVLRSRQLQHQPRADARRGRDPAGGLRRRGPARPARPADADARRVRLPRGDVGRPPAGRQHARRRLRRVRPASFDRLLRNAADARFERALREVAEG